MTRRQRRRQRVRARRWRRELRVSWRAMGRAAAVVAGELRALAAAAVETHEGLQALKCAVYGRGLPT